MELPGFLDCLLPTSTSTSLSGDVSQAVLALPRLWRSPAIQALYSCDAAYGFAPNLSITDLATLACS